MAAKRRPKQQSSERVVALTGAFGALGRRLLKLLEDDDSVDKIVAIDVRSALTLLEDNDDSTSVVLKHPKLSAHTLDLTTPGTDTELAELLRSERTGSVFHLALLSTPTHHTEHAHELETIGTHYVCNAAAAAGVARLVSVSSTMCYGARPDNPAFLTEQHPLRPPQARSLRDKAQADADVLRFGAEHPDAAVCVARLGAVVPTVRDHFWTRLLSRRVVPCVLGYDPLLQFLHPDDAAYALYALWQSRAKGAVNVVAKGRLPLSHILTRLRRMPLYLPVALGEPIVSALWQAQLAEIPASYFSFLRWSWLADDTLLPKLTGFTPKHDLHTILTIMRAAIEETR